MTCKGLNKIEVTPGMLPARFRVDFSQKRTFASWRTDAPICWKRIYCEITIDESLATVNDLLAMKGIFSTNG